MKPGSVIWFTGLSGAGKTTIARAFERKLVAQGLVVKVLDGDEIRKGLCSDLGYSREDRSENMRRVSEVAKLFSDAGFIVLVTLISPFESDRQRVRSMFPKDKFAEIFIDCPVEVCASRDTKGLYKRAAAGEITQMVGISLDFEAPQTSEVVLRTHDMTLEECVERLVRYFGVVADRASVARHHEHNQ